MGKGLDQLENIKDDGVRYVRLKWASMRLATVDKMSTLLGKAFGYAFFLVFIFIALIFLLAALAFWLGGLLGHLAYGFLISGGILLLVGLVVFLVRDKLVVNTLVRHLSDLFFTPEEREDGTKE